MFVEMTCPCGASFQMDAGDNTSIVELWAHSFVNAHHECGYMSTPLRADTEEKMKRYDVIYKEPREKEL